MITSRAGCRWCQTVLAGSIPLSLAGSQVALVVRSLSTTPTWSQGESSQSSRRHAPNTPSSRSSPRPPRQQANGSSGGQWPRKPRQGQNAPPGGLDFLNRSRPPAGKFREGLNPAKGTKDNAGMSKWSRGPRNDTDRSGGQSSFGIRQPGGSTGDRGGRRPLPSSPRQIEPAEVINEAVLDEGDLEDRRSRNAHRGHSRDQHGDSRSIRGRLGQSEEFALPSRPHRSNKGKGRDHEREVKRVDKPRKSADERRRQATVKQEKEVYIPSTVTVGRLADIFGKKLCKSTGPRPASAHGAVGLQRKMQQLGMSDDQIRPDYSAQSLGLR